MTPGLALFYGGLARSKNVLATIMQSFFMLGLISIQFVVIGYSPRLRPRLRGLIGDLDWVGLKDVSSTPPEPKRRLRHDHPRPDLHDLPDDVRRDHAGADHRRLRRAGEVQHFPASSWVLWATIVYDPVAHWVWGDGGWLGLVPDATVRSVSRRSTSRAARSSTSTPVSRPSPRQSLRQAPRLRP